MFKDNKLVKGVMVGISSLVFLGTGLGATNAYNRATTLPKVQEVEKTDKQALAIDLATSESYQEMLARSKKSREEASKKQMEKIIKDLEEKERKEKEAKEKAEQEAQQKLKQEQEELRLAEEQRLLTEQQEAQAQQEIQQEQVQEVSEQVQTVAESVQQAPVQEVQARTDGFNYNGNHYDISSFSGSGDVPHWTNSVYQWSDYPKHWLVERQSYAGQTINGLTIGSQVVKDGQTFTVYDIAYNQDRKVAQSLVYNNDATMTIQVCATDDALSDLHIYFLR